MMALWKGARGGCARKSLGAWVSWTACVKVGDRGIRQRVADLEYDNEQAWTRLGPQLAIKREREELGWCQKRGVCV